MSCPTVTIDGEEFSVCDRVRVFVKAQRQSGEDYWLQSMPMPAQEARDRVRNWEQVGYDVRLERVDTDSL